MPRAHRHFLPGLVWHLTHRCHKREFLLKFARDRNNYLSWLYEARKRFGLCVLNYMVTSNHAHPLIKDTGEGSTQRSRTLLRHAMIAGPNPSLLGASASLTGSKANRVPRQCTGKSVPMEKPLSSRNRCRLTVPISTSKMLLYDKKTRLFGTQTLILQSPSVVRPERGCYPALLCYPNNSSLLSQQRLAIPHPCRINRN
jgi:hypothetical protein